MAYASERGLGPFAGVEKDSVHLGLSVFGLHAEISSDRKAGAVTQRTLLPLHGDDDNLVDRFDARC